MRRFKPVSFPIWGIENFEIEKIIIDIPSRVLKATYTTELAEDLKSICGLDVEQELSRILQEEINKEILRKIDG